MSDFEEFLRREVEHIKAEVRDDMPDWPWAFGFNLGPSITEWDEELNPA